MLRRMEFIINILKLKVVFLQHQIHTTATFGRSTIGYNVLSSKSGIIEVLKGEERNNAQSVP